MKISITSIGKAKQSAEQALFIDYLKRIPWPVAVKELEAKTSLPPEQRKAQEATLLLDATQSADIRIALDESGKTLSSREFATQLSAWQTQGNSSFAFIIGGGDGLDASVLKSCQLVWSFGRVTWPHQLVRPLLAEQIYRAWSLMNNHPYHRD